MKNSSSKTSQGLTHLKPSHKAKSPISRTKSKQFKQHGRNHLTQSKRHLNTAIPQPFKIPQSSPTSTLTGSRYINTTLAYSQTNDHNSRQFNTTLTHPKRRFTTQAMKHIIASSKSPHIPTLQHTSNYLAQFVVQTTPFLKTKRHFSLSPINEQETPFTANQMDKFQNLIEKESQHVDSFFDVDPNEESDGPMTEPEDLHAYTRDFDQDNIKPELFDPETQTTEYMVATLLQGEIDKGVPMFPIYLRGAVFRKIVGTIDRIIRSGAEMSPEILTKILTDIFTNYAPELCRTHEHALNILFPMAPRLGDVVQLPTVTGQSIVSKREYLDHREDGIFDDDSAKNVNNDDDRDIGRFMVITYECLHPTLRGKSFVSKHPFDLDVFGLTMSRDEKGLEKLMHERGMIDMFSGRIINPLEQASKIPGLTGAGSQPLMVQQRATSTTDKQHNIKPALLMGKPEPLKDRPNPVLSAPGQMLELPGPGDLDGTTAKSKQLQIDGKSGQVLIGESDQNGTNSLDNGLQTIDPQSGVIIPGKPQYTVVVQDPTERLGRDQKHYYQQLVLSGDKAAFMYKQLVQELTQGKSKFEGGPAAGSVHSQHVESVQQQAKGNVTMSDIRNHGAVNARLGAKGASYGPDAFADFGAEVPMSGSGSNLTTSATTPNQFMTFKQQQSLDKEIEQGLDEVVAGSSKQSKYYQQYQDMKKLQREEMEKKIKGEETQLYSEVHAAKKEEENRIQGLKDKFNALIQYHIDQGKTVEEAQVLADQQFDPETGEINYKAGMGEDGEDQNNQEQEPDVEKVQYNAQEAYAALPQHYKSKYKHIIIKDGPGAGLPDPLAIEFGEDLFEIYPNANIALMDFLSDQWTLMVKEKQDQLANESTIQLQKEDDKKERARKRAEGLVNSEEEDENAPRERFLEETNEHNTNRLEIPKDIEATRYRLLAAVAAAGHVAFTADYVTELFDRVGRYEKDSGAELKERYIPMKHVQNVAGQSAQNGQNGKKIVNIEMEPDFQYNLEQQQYKRHKKEQEQQAIADQKRQREIDEAERENYIHDAEVVPMYNPPKNDTAVSVTPEGYIKHGDKLLTPVEYAEMVFGKKPIPIEESGMVPNKMKQMITDHYRYKEEMKQKKQVDKVTQSIRRFATFNRGSSIGIMVELVNGDKH